MGDRRLDGRGLILIRAMKFVESSTNILTVRLVCVVGGFMVLGLVGALPTPDFVWALVGDLCPSGFKKVGPVPGEGFHEGRFFSGRMICCPRRERKSSSSSRSPPSPSLRRTGGRKDSIFGEKGFVSPWSSSVTG